MTRMLSSLSVVVLLSLVIVWVEGSTLILHTKPEALHEQGPTVRLDWVTLRHFSELHLAWYTVSYSVQVTVRELGNLALDTSRTSYVIEDGLKYAQQYRFCLVGSNPDCPDDAVVCTFLKIPRVPTQKEKGPSFYLGFGPVHSKNMTVHWGEMEGGVESSVTLPAPEEGGNADEGAGEVVVGVRSRGPRVASVRGYKLTWRKVDGLMGHPGHSSNIVSREHRISGLVPATRYEVCLGETLSSHSWTQVCDVVATDEDLPGPPQTLEGSCRSQVRGTHWRCDVSWEAPAKTNGRITGYVIEWKDVEGYVLTGMIPHGSACTRDCYGEQVVSFHPFEVCVSARTSAGQGWEDCAPIHDVSTRILAFFELKVLLIIGITLVTYQLGPLVLKAVLKCCIRGLYRQLEGEKKHPV